VTPVEILAARIHLWLTNARVWAPPDCGKGILRHITALGQEICDTTGLDWQEVVALVNGPPESLFLYNANDHAMFRCYQRLSVSFSPELIAKHKQMLELFEEDMKDRYEARGLVPPKLQKLKVNVW